MLDTIIQSYQKNHNQEELINKLKDYFQVSKLDENVIAYLSKTVDTGMFSINSFENIDTVELSYKELNDCNSDRTFPAICVGSDGLGTYFWVMLETADVISLNHDATFEEAAMDAEADTVEEFTQGFIELGSALKIDELLKLQESISHLDEDEDDFQKDFFIATKEALDITYQELYDLLDNVSMEFIYQRCMDFIDDGEAEELLENA